MDQEQVPLESIPSTQNLNNNLILPTSFTIHKLADSETKFILRGNAGSSPLSLATSYKYTEDEYEVGDFEATVNIHSRKDETATPLATAKYSRHATEIQALNTSPPSYIKMYYSLLGDRNATHTFTIDKPQRVGFEWNNVGDGAGWKLYMTSRPEEILATGILNMGSDEPPRFEFTDMQMAAELNEQCRLFIIASWVKIWDNVRHQFKRAPDEGELELMVCSCGFCVIL